jgi:hypothetical protein
MFNTCSNSYVEGSERFKLSAYGPIEPRSPLTRKFSHNREFSPQSAPCRGRWLQTKHSDNIRERTSPVHDDAMDIGYTQGFSLTVISVTLTDSHWLWYRLHSRTHTDSDIGYTQGLWLWNRLHSGTLTLKSVTLRDSHWLWYRLHPGTHTDSDIGYTQGLILTLISVTLKDSHWLWYRLHSGTLDSEIGYTQGLSLTLISVTPRDRKSVV